MQTDKKVYRPNFVAMNITGCLLATFAGFNS